MELDNFVSQGNIISLQFIVLSGTAAIIGKRVAYQ